ncbi:hypothetical protein H6G81_32595 [Scytonema hofmannii FACHB-248]|uniref:Uncharacterized protein n=1 Tax=Scytonema hofmannii FACHB-248 TaxID=1842502 RepID=A0ABR8H102_9CYAN|nr:MULTISPECIES: hypothetical protein [Nostocales]MBD2609129.1 hypothetical protein [Scytonema hofmannii FACHB-248]
MARDFSKRAIAKTIPSRRYLSSNSCRVRSLPSTYTTAVQLLYNPLVNPQRKISLSQVNQIGDFR